MSSIHHAHLQIHHSPPHVRKAAIKSARSASVSKIALAPSINLKGAKTSRKVKEEPSEEEEIFQIDDDDNDMDSSFLQFCAMCEKQIVVPNSSILYCSESCRRRDAATTNLASSSRVLSGPPNMASFYNDNDMNPYNSKLPSYVPALQPTPRTIPDGRIPAKMHGGKSDLDPTEWKPADPNAAERKSSSKPGEWKPKLTYYPSSEAFSYLSKFHHSSTSLKSKRHPLVGPSGTTVSSRSIPGLSHTPTASTSSEESLSGTPYEFVARPSVSMPAESPPKSVASTKDGNRPTYEKKYVQTSFHSASGSLKKLLEHSAGRL